MPGMAQFFVNRTVIALGLFLLILWVKYTDFPFNPIQDEAAELARQKPVWKIFMHCALWEFSFLFDW
jgi:hypothetical protein